MALTHGIGRSTGHTERKHDTLASIVRMWLAITGALGGTRGVKDWSAGDGDGSARVVQEAMLEHGWHLPHHMIERHRGAFAVLERFDWMYDMLPPEGWPEDVWDLRRVHFGDCASVLPTLPRYDHELHLYDPTGLADALSTAARTLRPHRDDLILHVGACTPKRRQGAFGVPTPRLVQMLDGINKKHAAVWLDRIPDHKTSHQWCFVIMTDWPKLLSGFKGREAFYDVNTENGRYVLSFVSTTVEEGRPRRFELPVPDRLF